MTIRDKILETHGLQNSAIEPDGGINLHDVWLGKDIVLKLYTAVNPKGYASERWFYSHCDKDYVPGVIAMGELEGQAYLLMERLHGSTLYGCWHALSDARREQIAETICRMVLDMQDMEVDSLQQLLGRSSDWGNQRLQSTERFLRILHQQGFADAAFCHAVYDFVLDNVHRMDGERGLLMYPDLHFGNLMLTDSGKLFLYDFESLGCGPLDQAPSGWSRFLHRPWMYAKPAQRGLVRTGDYGCILPVMQRTCPQWFSHPDWERRSCLFDMTGMLDQLNDLQGDRAQADYILQRIRHAGAGRNG